MYCYRLAKVDVDSDRGYTLVMIGTFRKYDCLQLLLGVLLLMLCGGDYSVLHAEDDWGDDLEEKALQVNEGELVFLPSAVRDKKVHQHHNQIILHNSSLVDGWTTLHQCHRQIDAVPEAQIVFNKRRIRDLSVDSYRNIGQVWVEGHTIQLRDILAGAELCITGNSQSLSANPDGTYVLKNGPFMRRFLDGYFPMHVTMDIILPANCLRLEHVSPQQQKGFEVRLAGDRLSVDAWFEGRLLTNITFSANNDDEAKEHCTL